MRRFLHELVRRGPDTLPRAALTCSWLRAEQDEAAVAAAMQRVKLALDAALPASIWRDLERKVALTPEQDQVLRGILAEIPEADPAQLAETLHPPLRKAILAELARRDPSLAFRGASHLWARDLARLASGS